MDFAPRVADLKEPRALAQETVARAWSVASAVCQQEILDSFAKRASFDETVAAAGQYLAIAIAIA